jgi:zinc protease
MGKSNQLAHYSIFAGDPGYISEDLNNLLSVSLEDIYRVYETYIKDMPFIATSFVPRGQADLALEGSIEADIKEEDLTDEAAVFDVNQVVEYQRTPSSFDRTNEPPYGESPETPIPDVWETTLDNGLKVFGINNNEVPMINLNISVKGGQLLDDPDNVGVARMMGVMMNKGTVNKTPAELEEAIEVLGASISISSGRESIEIRMNCLEKNYNETLELLLEMMFEPRWDEKEFEIALESAKNSLEQQKASPGSIASNEFSRLIYGEDHIFSKNIIGSNESLNDMNISKIKDYYESSFSPDKAVLNYVGSIDQDDILISLAALSDSWESKEVMIPDYPVNKAPSDAELYFYDMPGAKQSVIYIGYPCMTIHDDDFYPATVMNYILGGGGFASRLTQVLRQEKGFTYGIRSGFSGTDIVGPFRLSTSVKTSNTLEALQLIIGIMEEYSTTFSEEDLDVTKGFLIKKNARAFETSGAKLGMLSSISKYGWDYDYVRQQEEIVRNMTVDEIRALAKKYVDPSKMIYLIVGDAETQMDGLEELGFGEAVLLN